MNPTKKILVIDDDSKNIYALSAVLKAKGYVSISAQSARKGLELLKTDPSIGLVLLDMMMPEMDGYQALTEIKKNPVLQNIPVIAVTAQAMTGDKEKCLEAGADGYLSKPVAMDQLLAVLQTYL
ncbi:response regulator [Chryseobacterium sp. A301]